MVIMEFSSRVSDCIAMLQWCDGAMMIIMAVVVAMNEVVIFSVVVALNEVVILTEYLLWGQCLFHSRTLIGKVLY